MEQDTEDLEYSMIKHGEKRWFEREASRFSGFAVHGLGYFEAMVPGLVNRPNGTEDHLLMLFHDPVQVGCGGHVCEAPAGSLIIWDAAMSHLYGTESGDWRHSWLHCGGRNVQRLLRESSLPLETVLRIHEDDFLDGIQRLYEERSHPVFDPVILENLFQNLLHRIRRTLRRQESKQIPQRLLNCQTHIESRYNQPLNLSVLAEHAHMSVSHFSAEYRRHFGIAPLQYRTRLRMEEAVYLLRDVNLSISEIAERLGYPDIYHFSKQFKKYYGQSPMGKRGGMR
jgi:AraC-like DNA-binding protein